MTTLKKGDQAPAFKGINQNGDEISSGSFAGKKIILYFYPKDNTPGCTAEACNLNDNYSEWIARGFEIVGVSEELAREAFRLAAAKLPLRTTFVARMIGQ